MAGQKVAAPGQVIEKIARNDVAEISVLAKPIRSSAKRGARIGAWAGAVAGAVGFPAWGQRCYDGSAACAAEGALVGAAGAVAGAADGAIIGAGVGAAKGKTQDVIYRALN